MRRSRSWRSAVTIAALGMTLVLPAACGGSSPGTAWNAGRAPGFIHAASWNGGNIGQRSTSHGWTNLTAADAERFFSGAPFAMRRTIGAGPTGSLFDVVDEYLREDRPR